MAAIFLLAHFFSSFPVFHSHLPQIRRFAMNLISRYCFNQVRLGCVEFDPGLDCHDSRPALSQRGAIGPS